MSRAETTTRSMLILFFALVIFLAGPALIWAQGNAADEAAVAPAGGEADATPGSETQEAGKLDIFSLLYKGGWVMIPIALASILALTLTIERFVSLRKIKIIPPAFLDGLEPLLKQNGADSSSGKDYCAQYPCAIANIIKAGFSKVTHSEERLQCALEDAGAREVDRMKRSLKPLSMIATISPLLGLLGTVYGMIGAFQAATAAGVGKSDVLAQGIYEALVTTAAGLTLAIPVLIVYQVLNNRVDSIVDELDDRAEEFIALAVGQRTAEGVR